MNDQARKRSLGTMEHAEEVQRTQLSKSGVWALLPVWCWRQCCRRTV